ncbi:hypothetical protein AA313_de0204580 [Arthrobotrys entomopaga]|nr:hypothetical protein AA313_de0204580 [Arthrobotrys entomopaga]
MAPLGVTPNATFVQADFIIPPVSTSAITLTPIPAVNVVAPLSAGFAFDPIPCHSPTFSTTSSPVPEFTSVNPDANPIPSQVSTFTTMASSSAPTIETPTPTSVTTPPSPTSGPDSEYFFSSASCGESLTNY